MVYFFTSTMLKGKGTLTSDLKAHLKKGKEPIHDNKRILRDACLLTGVIIIIVGCIVIFAFMDEDEYWAEKSYIRQRILLIAGLLLIASTGLCLYVMKSDRNQEKEELELLIIEKPPSYESVVLNDLPPSYIAVVQSIHIIQQETTG